MAMSALGSRRSWQIENKMFKTIQNDIQSVLDRDPAARNALEVLLCYPGLHAIWTHRLTHQTLENEFQAHRALAFANHALAHGN